MLMPPKSEGRTPSSLPWSYLANSNKLVWITEGYKDTYLDKGYLSGFYLYRIGFSKINIRGKHPTYLTNYSLNLPWKITYYINGSNGNLGFDTIKLHPTLPNTNFYDDICFGSLYDYCYYNPLPSLKNSKISYSLVCENGPPNAFTAIYLLKAKRKDNLYHSL